MRTIFLGILLIALYAFVNFLIAFVLTAFEIPTTVYHNIGMRFFSLSILFIGGRYFGKGIFYPALISHIVLSFIVIFLIANNYFILSSEYSEPFLTTLKKWDSKLLFELLTIMATLLLGILSRKYKRGKQF